MDFAWIRYVKPLSPPCPVEDKTVDYEDNNQADKDVEGAYFSHERSTLGSIIIALITHFIIQEKKRPHYGVRVTINVATSCEFGRQNFLEAD